MLDLSYQPQARGQQIVSVPVDALGADDPFLSQTAAMRALHDVTQILAGQGVVHYVCDGSLLGMIRDGGFIPNDNDIDFRVAQSGLTGPLLEALVDAGFFEFKRNYLAGRLISVGLFRDGITVDLYGADFRGDTERFDIVRKRGFLSYRLPFCGVEQIEFRGCGVFVPKNVRAHLHACYGPHWQAPVSDWDHLHSHQALYCATGGLGFLSASARRYVAAQTHVFPERSSVHGLARGTQLFRMYRRAIRMHRQAVHG